jgi:hypothetical protein
MRVAITALSFAALACVFCCQNAGAVATSGTATITTEWRTNPLTTSDIPVLSAVSLVKRAFLCVSPFWRDALSH